MKGSWVTTFAAGGVILVLTLFLGLQYNWLRKAGDAEREQMQRRTEADTKAFADEFNREVQAAFISFQLDAGAWERADWTEFNERYDFWREKTSYPELIKEFIFFPEGNSQPLRYDPAKRGFEPGPVAPEITALHQRIESSNPTEQFFDEESVLVAPVYDLAKRVEGIRIRGIAPGKPPEASSAPPREMPERRGLLMVLLDRDVITGRILPELASKHFPDGDFRVSVRSASGGPVFEPSGTLGQSDAAAGLVSLVPDNMIFVTDRGFAGRFKTERREGAILHETVESKTFTRTVPDGNGGGVGQFRVELQSAPGLRTRTTAFTAADPPTAPWTLSVQHTAGSIDAFARGQLTRNFLIGLGIYLLLAGAIIAIVLSALRSKRFAQRQIDFVSSVSHEFRTPLAVIYSAGESLADGVANDREQVGRYGNLIKGEGRKLSAMVEQILQFAGARSGKRKYNFSTVKPADLVAAALNECSPILEEKGFEVELSIDEKLPQMRADVEAVSTALQNLITNAVKYSNGSRWLRVSASNGGGTLKLSVEDRGIGIARGDLKQVFEPFYRAKNVVDAQIHGNGLGLALVKQIAEAHGGSVRASSDPDKGSKFTIELPQK